jgi:hypothetical protein
VSLRVDKRDVERGMLLRSIRNHRTTAKVVSVTRNVDGSTRVVLNFGWDSPRARLWSTTISHVAKYYMRIG